MFLIHLFVFFAQHHYNSFVSRLRDHKVAVRYEIIPKTDHASIATAFDRTTAATIFQAWIKQQCDLITSSTITATATTTTSTPITA